MACHIVKMSVRALGQLKEWEINFWFMVGDDAPLALGNSSLLCELAEIPFGKQAGGRRYLRLTLCFLLFLLTERRLTARHHLSRPPSSIQIVSTLFLYPYPLPWHPQIPPVIR